ncbi:hypothetical protein SynMINOS11_00345 [Synechococcus sp. Minos11]|nr:hypothetical protein SynMINOS11_00345 [Synechococcus sp. Minos11]
MATEQAPGSQLFIPHDSREKGRGSTKRRPFRQRAFFFGKTAVEMTSAGVN